jgi:uncharacterized protein
MKRDEYKTIENYMLSCMNDSSHDCEHVMRVLYIALRIAQTEQDVDRDILITACLLHDIGRDAQFKDPNVCHAAVGATMAQSFLLGIGWDERRAAWVRDCIRTHRFRGGDPPASIEAKILFDADKLDVSGAMGIARTLMYQGQVGAPLYTTEDGKICSGDGKTFPESFYKEYHNKLKSIHLMLYTQGARDIARARSEEAAAFFEALSEEVNDAYAGRGILDERLEE